MYLELIPQILPIYIPLILIILIFRLIRLLILNETKWINKREINKKKKNMKEKLFFLRLFISFDPKTTIFREINWIIILFRSFIILLRFWKKPSRIEIMLIELTNQIRKQFKIALKRKKDRRNGIFISLFLLILFINFIGLFPNIFTPSSHISLNIIISFPIWVGFLSFGWTKFTNKILRHLVPSGTPIPLIRFIVLIELIRNIIRSLTLGIRLIANIVSGHLLLTLIGNLIENRSFIIVTFLVFLQRILTSLEIGVAFIQAYVFCILLTLYSDDSDFN